MRTDDATMFHQSGLASTSALSASAPAFVPGNFLPYVTLPSGLLIAGNSVPLVLPSAGVVAGTQQNDVTSHLTLTKSIAVCKTTEDEGITPAESGEGRASPDSAGVITATA